MPGLQCHSPGDEFSSCDDLIKNRPLRACLWVLGILAILGNISVVVWRLTRGQDRRVYPFLVINLAVSDLLMGIYLLIIAIKDAQWQGEYFKHDVDWRSGSVCQLAGALSMLSSEVSVLMLTLITFDRLYCIVFPFSLSRLTWRKTYVLCAVIWIFGIVISCLPVVGMEYFSGGKNEAGFFGRSSVCLPLQLSEDKPPGWEYSVGIFIAFNLFAFTFMLFAYLAIFWTLRKSPRRNEDAAMTGKIMFIILTDFCCWMPVIVIGILSLTGNFHDPKKIAYVFISIFVLPVNSSINPILYTFSGANFRQAFFNSVRRCGAFFVAKCKPPVFPCLSVSVIVTVFLFFNQSIRQRFFQTFSFSLLRWRVQERPWWRGCSKPRRGSRDGAWCKPRRGSQDGTWWRGCSKHQRGCQDGAWWWRCSKPRSSCQPCCGRSFNANTEGKEIEADWRIQGSWRRRGECSKLDAGVSEISAYEWSSE